MTGGAHTVNFVTRLISAWRGPRADWLALDGNGLAFEEDRQGWRIWRLANGDSAGIVFITRPPDLPRSRTVDDFVSAYGKQATAGGASVVDVTLVKVAGFRAVRSITKIPQSPRGMTYVGALTLPFADCSYSVTVHCPERGTTGARDALLLARALGDGSVTVSPEGIHGQWAPDAETHDAHFPESPVARVRRHLPLLVASLRIDDRLRRVPPFDMPG